MLGFLDLIQLYEISDVKISVDNELYLTSKKLLVLAKLAVSWNVRL